MRSKVTVTVTHTGQDGTSSITDEVIYQDDEEDEQSAEMANLAAALARMVCALESLSSMIPCCGEDVLDAFSASFNERYQYWKNKS